MDPVDVTELADGRIAFAFREFNNSDWDVYTTIFDPRDKTINGTSQDDLLTSRIDGATVNGLNGDDELLGFEGKDKLNGGSGDDTLDGGANKDTLNGGRGKDTLTGGTGSDRFDFNSIKESVKGGQRDVITDFKRGQGDMIDLKGIDAKTGISGNQKFAWIGKDDFSGVKGELLYKDLGSKVIVQGDVNGDGKADFEILVKAGSLNAGDFLL